MSIYVDYDFQSSHEGYIDMEFKELVDFPPTQDAWQLSSCEVFDYVIDGYYVEGAYVPKYMDDVFQSCGDLKQARVSKRLVKKWCHNVSENGFNYGILKLNKDK